MRQPKDHALFEVEIITFVFEDGCFSGGPSADSNDPVEKRGSGREITVVINARQRPEKCELVLAAGGKVRALNRLFMLRGHELSNSGHSALIAHYTRELWVVEDVIDRPGLVVDEDDVADKSDPVTVVRIVRAVDCTEGLNGNARRTVPAIDGDFPMASD